MVTDFVSSIHNLKTCFELLVLSATSKQCFEQPAASFLFALWFSLSINLKKKERKKWKIALVSLAFLFCPGWLWTEKKLEQLQNRKGYASVSVASYWKCREEYSCDQDFGLAPSQMMESANPNHYIQRTRFLSVNDSTKESSLWWVEELILTNTEWKKLKKLFSRQRRRMRPS